MLEVAFKTELINIRTSDSLIEKLWEEIIWCYSQPNRYYHNLLHLHNLVNELSVIRDKIDDWQTIMFSVAYHDIVYNVLKTDNEERSADFADERLALLKLVNIQKERCRQQILATKRHSVSADGDTNFFIDADLAILGSEHNLYKTYSEQVRKEYKYFPDVIYNPGRRKVLRRFLQSGKIYKTKHFAEKYECQARENINRELKELE